MDNKNKNRREKIFDNIALFIVRSRYFFFILFAAALVFCVISINKVKTNSDLTSYLPPDSETRRGLSLMEDEFASSSSVKVMVKNIGIEEANGLYKDLQSADHVAAVLFDDTSDHYSNGSALFNVMLNVPEDSKENEEATEKIKESLSNYDCVIVGSTAGDYQKQLAKEMTLVVALCAAVILIVLLLTSISWFEIVISAIVFVIAALLNMGTNYLLGTLSSITNSVAVILQLALAIDYAIIFSHNYQREAASAEDTKTAVIKSLSRSITEIFSSSLTTVSGLAALTLMQFRLGHDLGIVLSKGIVCSMLTVFLIMPGLTVIFGKLLKNTKHRSLIPRIDGWGRFLTNKPFVFLILFVLILPTSLFFSSKTEYAFSDSSITELIYSESRAERQSINDTFGHDTTLAVIVPKGDFEKEKAILKEASSINGVKSVSGLSAIVLEEGRPITDEYSSAEFAALFGIEENTSKLLYLSYRLTTGENKYPLVNILTYLFESAENGTLPLDSERKAMIDEKRSLFDFAIGQYNGKTRSRLVITSYLPAEGNESTALVDKIRSIAEDKYGKGNVIITGDITSAKDLRDSYNYDSVLISVLTAVFVFLILLFTFKTPVGAAVLVFVIQASIWINFSMPYIAGMHCSFVTHMIVSAIQMGATIDYAIVIMSRYLSNRKLYDKKQAMTNALSESFATVMTSGTIMTAAGFLVAYIVSDVYVGHIGLAVGRGALISSLMVMTVLPQLILLFDRFIFKSKTIANIIFTS